LLLSGDSLQSDCRVSVSTSAVVKHNVDSFHACDCGMNPV
jgi:hypothetical protein